MTPKEIADIILREQGEWMVSQLGDRGLVDCIFDASPDFHAATDDERALIIEAVRQELFS